MLTLYSRVEGRLIVDQRAEAGAAWPEAPVWIDMLGPSAEEEARVEAFAGINIPTPEEMHEIETSSRLYRDGDALVMTVSVMNRTETPEPETRAITFILARDALITLRYCEPQPFRAFPVRLKTNPELGANAQVALVSLLDAIIDRIADSLELVDAKVGELSRAIFAPFEDAEPHKPDYGDALKIIGTNAIRCSKVEESLVGLSRLLIFLDAGLRQRHNGYKAERARIKDLQRDISSLEGYTDRLSEKLQFLLEATLGLINIQQNGIIKIFSVVAVVFLPPTLIASIYGMNFEVMPELSWPWGYPMALVMMVLSAIFPYLFFKRKGWL